jgi:hypothetical protein
MKAINILFIALGFLFFVIGLIGVLIPVLPTTPFIILASASFVKGSPRFDRWLKGTKIYKDYAEDFIKSRSMTFKRKAQLMALSDLMLLFPLIKVDNTIVRIFIIAVIIIKYWYFIFKIKTAKE